MLKKWRRPAVGRRHLVHGFDVWKNDEADCVPSSNWLLSVECCFGE
jgi:hypothetical protein